VRTLSQLFALADLSHRLSQLNVVPVSRSSYVQLHLILIRTSASKITVGLGTSILVLVLAIALVGNLEGEAEAVDSTGILQIIWLIRDHPDLQRLIGQVKRPSANDLREAGMVSVCMAGGD